MTAHSIHTLQQENAILCALPEDEFHQLAAQDLEPVVFQSKQTIYERGTPIEHVYFPCQSVFSTINFMIDGADIEIATIGNEGFYSIETVNGEDQTKHTTICQIQGSCLRLPVHSFRRLFHRLPTFAQCINQYAVHYFAQLSQFAACNLAHSIEQRIARRVLMTLDRVKEAEFELTHEFLAEMLGVQRSSVSLIANTFQQQGLLQYHHGKMAVTNRSGLEKLACECYQATKAPSQAKRWRDPELEIYPI